MEEKKKKKKKKKAEEEQEEIYEVDEDSDIIVHETYTKQGKVNK